MRKSLLIMAALLGGCAAEVSTVGVESFDPEGFDKAPGGSAWVAKRIAEFESGKSVSPQIIQRVSYQGVDAFLFLAPCCDRLNYLYDRAGNRICAPSGGLTGRGDGKCTLPLTALNPGRAKP